MEIEDLPVDPLTKSSIILVQSGLKPATVTENLVSLDIISALRASFIVIEDKIDLGGVIISLKSEIAEELEQCFLDYKRGIGGFFEKNYRIGILLGFPETAVRAYSTADFNQRHERKLLLIRERELPPRVRRAEFMAFLNFRLSRENWYSELNTVKLWAEKIKEVGPALYREIVREHKTNSRA